MSGGNSENFTGKVTLRRAYGEKFQQGWGELECVEGKIDVVEGCVPEYTVPVLFWPNEMPLGGFRVFCFLFF